LDLTYRVLPSVRWYELVMTGAREQYALDLQHLEMDQECHGRIHLALGLHPSREEVKALAERGSHLQRYPETALEEGVSSTVLLHIDGECKKTASD
jgi:hypothetical protein